jgi:hypothetical protein
VSEIPTSEAAKVTSKFHHRFNGDWMGGTLITNKWWFNSWMFTGSWSQAIHVRRSWGSPKTKRCRQFFVRNLQVLHSPYLHVTECRGQLYTETDGRSKNAKKWPTQLVFILPKSHTEPVYVASSNTSIVFSVHFWELPILVSFVFFLRHLHIWLPHKLAGPVCLHWIQFHAESSLTKTSELTEEEVYIYICRFHMSMYIYIL